MICLRVNGTNLFRLRILGWYSEAFTFFDKKNSGYVGIALLQLGP